VPARADFLRLANNDFFPNENWTRLQRETFAPQIQAGRAILQKNHTVATNALDQLKSHPPNRRPSRQRLKTVGIRLELNQLGSYRLALLLPAEGDYAGARQLCERALAIREKVLGAEHSLTAAGSTPTPLLHHRCNNLTIACQSMRVGLGASMSSAYATLSTTLSIRGENNPVSFWRAGRYDFPFKAAVRNA
jgi:hypothetical protein